MKRRRVLHNDNVPARLPVYGTLTGWLFLDRMGIPSWGWGVFWTLTAIIWALAIWLVCVQERVHVKFEEKP